MIDSKSDNTDKNTEKGKHCQQVSGQQAEASPAMGNDFPPEKESADWKPTPLP